MRKNLLKQLFLALALTVIVPCVKAQIAHMGDILCTTGVYVTPSEYAESGLEAMGVIFYVDATGQHGWAVALEDAGSFSWGPEGSETPLPNFNSDRAAVYDLDGLFNTQEVLSYGISVNKSYPAFETLDVADGWYLPAIGQLNYLYGSLVEVNASLAIVGGTTFDMSMSWGYWSSTEHTGTVVYYIRSTGKIQTDMKGFTKRVRGVRSF